MYYKSIEDLPLHLFIECSTTGNLKALVKEGEVPEAELQEAWDVISGEYIDAVADYKTKYIATLQKEVEVLKYRISLVTSILFVLEAYYEPTLVEALKEMRFNVKGLEKDNPQFGKAVQKVLFQLAPLRVALRLKSIELSKYYKNKKGATVTKSYYTKLLVKLSKYMGYTIRANAVTVAEFVHMLHDMSQAQK